MEKRINLFITEQGSTVKVDGGRIVVRKGSENLVEVPIIHLRHVIIFGQSTITPEAVSRLLKEGVLITFLTKYGRFQGTVLPAIHSDGVIRKVQIFRAEENSFRIQFAREIVSAKIHNSIWFLKTRRKNKGMIKDTLKEMQKLEKELEDASNIKEIRGIEGISSRVYFSALQNLLAKGFSFQGRYKHPSPDPVNALLSLSYTLLYSICFSFLHINGLDPFIGFFHEPKRGHASLASDIMEEFRVPLCDLLVLRLVNQGYFSSQSFINTEKGVFLERESLKRFLKEFSSYLDKKIAAEKSFQISRWHLIEHQIRKLRKSILKGESYSPYRIGEVEDNEDA